MKQNTWPKKKTRNDKRFKVLTNEIFDNKHSICDDQKNNNKPKSLFENIQINYDVNRTKKKQKKKVISKPLAPLFRNVFRSIRSCAPKCLTSCESISVPSTRVLIQIELCHCVDHFYVALLLCCVDRIVCE